MIRRQYIEVATQALRQGRVGRVVRQVVTTAVVPVSSKVGRPLTGPLIANLIVTYRCNSRCFMCDLPKRWFYETRGLEEMSTTALEGVIDDLAAIGTTGIGLSGGEPTLRKDCVELLRHAKQRDLHVHINTNGATLTEVGRVDALLESGVDSINISLDASNALLHDRLRGDRGAFDRVTEATELILSRRKGQSPRVSYVTVVSPDNRRELPEIVATAKRRGVDAVSFMPLHGVYSGASAPIDVAEVEEAVEWIREYRRGPDGRIIDSSDAYLSLFGRALRGEPSPLQCFASYNHVLVDCYGNVFPCHYIFETGAPIGNIRDTPLREMWSGAHYRAVRKELSKCSDCYWNCHTEMNLLYQRRGEGVEHVHGPD
jgi:MoaA/NifB/PqqE/SkfB family radical SAM enzyme